MSTSVIEKNRKTARIYLFLTLFCCLFAAVYEALSHHVLSLWMIGLPLFPALLGLLPFSLLKGRIPDGWGRQFWHCAVATAMAGSCLTGIFEIAGIHMPYTTVFLAVSGALMLLAIAVLIAESNRTMAS